MRGFNFTSGVREVFRNARETAQTMGHDRVDPIHLLSGILRNDVGVAIATLVNLGVDLEALKRSVEHELRSRPTLAIDGSTDLAYTDESKRTLELTMASARDLDHPHVDTEDLLLGIVRHGSSSAALLLRDAGVTIDTARAEVTRLVGPVIAEAEGSEAPSIVVTVDHGTGGAMIGRKFQNKREAIDYLEQLDF